MLKHLIYIVLFFFSTTVISQTASYKPIIEINKTWDEIYVGNPPGITGIDGAERFHIGRDTMINSLIYYFVNYQFFLPQNPGPFWFPLYLDSNVYEYDYLIREDTTNRKVFLLDIINQPQAPEELIYDFSILPGDSLTIKGRTIYLDSISPYVLENGDTTRIFHFTDPPCTPWNPTYFVEGIGGVAGLMFPIDICFEGDATLSCVLHDNILLYKNTDTYFTCDIGTGIIGIKEENKFQLFPNPASNELNFHHLICKPNEIKIVDITGNIVSIQGFSEKVNITLLKSGIYFVKLIYQDKIETMKFIKK